MSILAVPDGKVYSLEAAVLANYPYYSIMTEITVTAEEKPSLPRETMKTRNNFSEILIYLEMVYLDTWVIR